MRLLQPNAVDKMVSWFMPTVSFCILALAPPRFPFALPASTAGFLADVLMAPAAALDAGVGEIAHAVGFPALPSPNRLKVFG
ncbi:hypothetical protein ACLKA7_001186 [Drosophila subpalustris]